MSTVRTCERRATRARRPARSREPTGTASVRRRIAEMVHRIVGRFQPEKVILFGSLARGAAGKDSDIDLLVVMPVVGSKLEKQIELRLAVHDIRGPKDILVATPEEMARQRNLPGTIANAALHEGRLLYERT